MSENLRDMIWFFEFSDRRRRKKKRGSEIRDYIEEAREKGKREKPENSLNPCPRGEKRENPGREVSKTRWKEKNPKRERGL